MTSASPTADDPLPPRPTDADLLARHVAGSAAAFGDLIDRHSDRLWAVALRIVRDRDEAADVVQEATIKAFRAAPGFRGHAEVSTWLHRIVVNTALDSLRRSARDDVVAAEPEDPPDPRDRMAARDVELDVAAALAALPDDQRAAVVLVDLEGFSVDDAAAILDCPPGTVKSRCFRGRRRLAGLLADYGPRPGHEQSQRELAALDPGERNPGGPCDVQPPATLPASRPLAEGGSDTTEVDT